ncbi:hypothetical protein NPIL_697161, partial [Nephila pilipes]
GRGNQRLAAQQWHGGNRAVPKQFHGATNEPTATFPTSSPLASLNQPPACAVRRVRAAQARYAAMAQPERAAGFKGDGGMAPQLYHATGWLKAACREKICAVLSATVLAGINAYAYATYGAVGIAYAGKGKRQSAYALRLIDALS